MADPAKARATLRISTAAKPCALSSVAAGGGFDTYTPVMARHMGHIPGNPALLVENMTGAGTLIAAKYLHSNAKPTASRSAFSTAD